MAKGKASGYVFGIKDPRLTAKGLKDIIFVGNGRLPWQSVERHLRESSNLDVYEWSKGLFNDFPEGIMIHDSIVCDAFHGEEVKFPEPSEGRTLVEWVILDEEVDEDLVTDGGGIKIVAPRGSRKSQWIHRLKAEGHPLLNKESGRPKDKDDSK